MIKCELTKRGFPALWEQGGAASNTGSATIIANKKGEKKTPIFVRNGGHLSNSNHALFVLEPDDIVVTVSRWRDNVTIIVNVLDVFDGENFSVKEKFSYSEGEWDKEIPEIYNEAVEAAVGKSRDYHCRTMWYGNTPEKRY